MKRKSDIIPGQRPQGDARLLQALKETSMDPNETAEIEIDQPFDVNGRKHWMAGQVSMVRDVGHPDGWQVLEIDVDCYDMNENGDPVEDTRFNVQIGDPYNTGNAETAADMLFGGIVNLIEMGETQKVIEA